MINKQQWIILPPRKPSSFRASPFLPLDVSLNEIDVHAVPLAVLESMQFGHALDCILCEILLSNPGDLGPVSLMLKIDMINLNIDDIPKLGVIFPTEPGQEPLVALPLVLPMGWKNIPPVFGTVTETIADLANQRIQDPSFRPPEHHLDVMSESIPPPDPLASDTPIAAPSMSPNLNSTVELPVSRRDPSLPKPTKRLGYVDICVDDFMALAQDRLNKRRVRRRTLLQAIDQVFRPLETDDPTTRRELKKLQKGDCSQGKIKVILGWIINTATMTIHLPPHCQQESLSEILSSIPPDKKRASVKKWHTILGELHSALPGSRSPLFSHMQKALLLSTKQQGHRIALQQKNVHQAVKDFKWILDDISSRPPRIAELVPMLSSAEAHHDDSGTGAGGV